MLIASLVIAATVAAFIYLMRPSVRTNVMWGAMITPLASIIGSGFLILGPVLNDKFGGYAPLIMLGLCVVSYFFGAAVRRNIVTTEWGAGRDPQRKRLDSIGGWALAFSYMISLPYYLNVMGAFAVSLTPFDGQLYGRIVATAAFILILLAGWLKGFDALEEMEKYSVSIKLAIIVGLLVGMAAFFDLDRRHAASPDDHRRSARGRGGFLRSQGGGRQPGVRARHDRRLARGRGVLRPRRDRAGF